MVGGGDGTLSAVADAMAETGSIDAGRSVEVVRTYDNQVKVREVSE